jgi:hypothetical protein
METLRHFAALANSNDSKINITCVTTATEELTDPHIILIWASNKGRHRKIRSLTIQMNEWIVNDTNPHVYIREDGTVLVDVLEITGYQRLYGSAAINVTAEVNYLGGAWNETKLEIDHGSFLDMESDPE